MIPLEEPALGLPRPPSVSLSLPRVSSASLGLPQPPLVSLGLPRAPPTSLGPTESPSGFLSLPQRLQFEERATLRMQSRVVTVRHVLLWRKARRSVAPGGDVRRSVAPGGDERSVAPGGDETRSAALGGDERRSAAPGGDEEQLRVMWSASGVQMHERKREICGKFGACVGWI